MTIFSICLADPSASPVFAVRTSSFKGNESYGLKGLVSQRAVIDMLVYKYWDEIRPIRAEELKGLPPITTPLDFFKPENYQTGDDEIERRYERHDDSLVLISEDVHSKYRTIQKIIRDDREYLTSPYTTPEFKDRYPLNKRLFNDVELTNLELEFAEWIKQTCPSFTW